MLATIAGHLDRRASSGDGAPAPKQPRTHDEVSPLSSGEIDADILDRIASKATSATATDFESMMAKHMEQSDEKWNGRVTTLMEDVNKRIDSKIEASEKAQEKRFNDF